MLHALHDSFRKLRSFVFIERISEVTEAVESTGAIAYTAQRKEPVMFTRLMNVIRGFFGLFVSGVEKRNPEALLEVDRSASVALFRYNERRGLLRRCRPSSFQVGRSRVVLSGFQPVALQRKYIHVSWPRMASETCPRDSSSNQECGTEKEY